MKGTLKVNNNHQNDGNPVGKVLRWIGIVTFVCGFIAGIVVGNAGREFSWLSAFYVWLACFISGMLFLGFSEIIKLLQVIADKCIYEINIEGEPVTASRPAESAMPAENKPERKPVQAVPAKNSANTLFNAASVVSELIRCPKCGCNQYATRQTCFSCGEALKKAPVETE